MSTVLDISIALVAYRSYLQVSGSESRQMKNGFRNIGYGTSNGSGWTTLELGVNRLTRSCGIVIRESTISLGACRNAGL